MYMGFSLTTVNPCEGSWEPLTSLTAPGDPLRATNRGRGLGLPGAGRPGATDSRPGRVVEVQVLIVAAGVLEARVVAPRDGGIALDAAEDPARRGDGRVEVKRRAGSHIDVAVRVHAAVEGHVRAGGDLEIDAGAVEDAELEERHLDLAEDLGQAGG